MTNAPEFLISRPSFQLISSRGFNDWLAGMPLSLALTTYHRGGVIMLGTKPGGEVSLHVAAFNRSMGCWTDGQTLWLVTERMLWRLENDLADGQRDDGGYDRVFVPRVGYATGAVDGHEVSADGQGRPVFVNTRFSCLAMVDERFSFRPLWHPPFVSQLAPEDRCHLSGLAVAAGAPKYVTMHARSDVADGWRDFRESGGLVMDVTNDEIIADGLSMPHSPRIHEGRLWLLNSGTGHLGFIDPATGKFEPVTFLPGYARGLAFHAGYAFVGLSKPRREHAFQGLPLEKHLAERGAAARCGLHVIDTTTGAVLHWARIESVIEELFDVAVLPGVQKPKALSITSSTYAHQLTFMNGRERQRWTVAPPEQEHNFPASPKGEQMASHRTPPDTAEGMNNVGLTHVEQGDWDEALRRFEQAASIDPHHAEAQNNLGNALRQQGQLEQAIDCFRRALAADPNNARAYFHLGQTLSALGRLAPAAASFSRSLRLEPNNVEAGVSLGISLMMQGKLDEAEQCFRQALELQPKSSSAYHGLGLVYRERGDLQRAVECFDAALCTNPDASSVLANKDLVMRKIGQLDETLACQDQVQKSKPSTTRDQDPHV